MAGSTRHELTSASLEGLALPASYPSGQRGNYSGVSLDRSGSFREGVESRMLSSGTGSIRGNSSSSADMPPLSQILTLEPITMGDQKCKLSGELRRVLAVSLGSTSEDAFGGAHSKSPVPLATEELKRFKTSVQDTSLKARDRARMFSEFILKLERYEALSSKKRQRTELLSSERSGGANMLKMGNQIHRNPPDVVTQRLEDRTKNVVLNKRVRTSIAEAEGRATALSRQPLVLEKDREMLKAGSGDSVQVEEKIRRLPAGGEGWDKKMKRKRSVGVMVARTTDGDREIKRAMHQKLSNDPRSRSSDAHGFRSGPSNGISGVNKLDVASQSTSSNARAVPRNELESVSFPRDRVTGLDKERLVAKGNKLNIREDNQVGSPGIVTKGKASRAPRTGSVMLPSSSPNIPRTPGSLEGWEQPTGLNKVQSMGEANNRKRPMPAGSSSPPMAQWVGQRPQKISRTRRANLVSPVSNQDEAQISSESLPATDFGARITSNGNNGSLLARGVVNNTQQFKMKLENISSPARLSESEESGAGENKLKEKGMDASEVEDKPVNAIQKVGSFLLPTKKSKILTKEETGDGVRRQGRSGRGSSLSRTGATPVREKLENPAMPKPVRGMRPGSDKNESKSGRPPSKKLSDRKAFSRSGHVLHGGSSDFTGESDDDHEELLLAAASARDANYAACSGLFWKKTEPIFASVGSDDASYLKEQLCFAEELDESLSQMFGTDNILDVAALSGKAEPEQRFDKVTPLYQRVLSALIEEDIIEGSDNYERRSSNYQHNGVDSSSDTYIHGDVELKDGDQVESEIESEADLQSKRRCSVDRFSCNGNAISNSFRSPSIYNPLCDEPCQGDDGLLQSEVGVPGFCPNSFVGPQHVQSNISSISSFDCQYQQLSLDDKLLLELQSIGLYPESVPDLTEGEEDTMNQDIIELKQGLYKQAEKKKMQLGKIDKGIKKEKEVEGRNLEQVAMNKLIEMAYKKYMACRGINASKSGVSKISKQVAMAFVKRSLARYRKFEETGRSSFDEPALRATIFAAPSFDNGAASVDCVDPGAAANSYREAHNCRFDPRASGALTSMLEQPHIDNLDMGSSAAYQALSYSSDQPLAKQEPISNRVKKREVLLDDVGGSTSVRATSALGNTFLGGAKGKRSERDRDQNKDMLAKNSVAKAGRPSLGSFRGERKTKTKPKQKIAQLSTSGNGLLGRHAEKTHLVYPSVHTSGESMTKNSNKVGREVGLLSHGTVPKDSSKDTEEPVDFTNLQMNELDPIEELGVSNDLGGPQDLSSWLNFDEDVLQDHDLQEHDSVGLEIPMDDLSELNMLM